MDEERFQQIQETLAAALERPAAERSAFLEERCGDDRELRSEVESLLAASDEADGYFSGLAGRAGLDEATADIEAETTSLVGQTISRFEVTGELGRGGMGTVYRAVDTRLQRQVALKLLPDEVADDEEAVARFQREARLLAALNHFNIAALYDLERADGRWCIVLELVEGDDLSDRLRAGPLPVDEALQVARQVAEALEAAHARGVVHRDLKPGNIKVTEDGTVKVLDFGIAKALDTRPGKQPDVTPSPTELLASTRAGRVLGTASYMSPEQARGKTVDPRSDIWAFGVVLFEMLAGQRPFEGDDPAQTLARIIEREPEWDALPDDTPAPVRALLERCLTRDPRQRLQAIGEARIVIDAHRAHAEGGRTSERRPRAPRDARRGPLPLLVAAAAVVVVAMLAWNLRPTPDNGGPAFREFLLAIPMDASTPRISPDGSMMYYLLDAHVWVRSFGQLEGRRLEGSAGALNTMWSPDSRFVLFRRDDQLWKIPVEGGNPQRICDVPPGVYYQAAWAPDDTIYFILPEGMYRVSAAGGTPVLVLARDGREEPPWRDPTALPDGTIVFAVTRESRFDAWDGRQRSVAFQDSGGQVRYPSYSSGGFLLYSKLDSGIWAVPFSSARAAATGEPFMVAADANVASVSNDGDLVYMREAPQIRQLVWVDRNGVVQERLSTPQTGMAEPALSPDGRRVAVSAVAGGRTDIWIHDLDSGSLAQLTLAVSERNQNPFWHPSGKRIGFNRAVGTENSLWMRSIDSGEERQVAEDGIYGAFTPGGEYLLVHNRVEETGADIWLLAGDGSESRPFLMTRQHEGRPRVSPDGRLLAHLGGPTGAPQVFVRTLPQGDSFWQVSTDTGNAPRWSSTGNEIYYWQDEELMAVAVDTSASVPRFGRPQALFDASPRRLVPQHYDVGADGRFLMLQSVPADGASLPRGAVYVENWAADPQR
jgi:Tol biopolymer transport system component/aminoglycoside phosphotransferase (APT) family kinase protein